MKSFENISVENICLTNYNLWPNIACLIVHNWKSASHSCPLNPHFHLILGCKHVLSKIYESEVQRFCLVLLDICI